MSWINLTKANLDVAECHYIAFLNWTSFTVGDADAVNVRAVCRARISHQEVVLNVHFQRCMNLRNARVVQLKIIVGSATNIYATATGDKYQFDFFRTFGKGYSDSHRNFGFLSVRLDGLPQFLFQILLLKLFLEFPETRFNGDASGKDINLCFDDDRSKRPVTVVVYMVDCGC